jgi:hypothetical protein
MAVAQHDLEVPGVTRPMTYEEYLASPEEMARYDILGGKFGSSVRRSKKSK